MLTFFRFALGLCLAAAIGTGDRIRAASRPASPDHSLDNTAPEVQYVGSKACRGCHPSEYESFERSEMARSVSTPNRLHLNLVNRPTTIYNQALNRHFRVYTENGEMYQSEYQLDEQGQDIFRTTRKLKYVVGAGDNGYSFLVDNSGKLCEAPLSWYAKPARWDFSPGYDHTDYGFSRPADEACLNCHGSPALGRQTANVTLASNGAAITCENCHGPGQLHVAEHTKRQKPTNAMTIVNPAKLSQSLSNDICVSCHESGTIRILKPARKWSDFRPGLPADLTFSIFQIARGGDTEQESPLLGHYSGLIRSRCYRESESEMRCITCHDPHPQSGTDRVDAGSSKCLACHSETSCLRANRTSGQAGSQCAHCHMTRLSVPTISHSILTSHTIRRKPVVFTAQSGDNSRLVRVTTTSEDPKAVDRVTLFTAYYQLIREHPELAAAYGDLFESLTPADRDTAVVLSATATLLRRRGDTHSLLEAKDILIRATQLGSTYPADYLSLAELLDTTGDVQGAVSMLKHGLQIAPFFPDLYGALASLYTRNHEYKNAAEVIDSYLTRFPQDSTIRSARFQLQDTNQ